MFPSVRHAQGWRECCLIMWKVVWVAPEGIAAAATCTAPSAFRKVLAGFIRRPAEALSGSSQSRAALQEGMSWELRVTPVQAMPSLTRVQSCSIWSGGTGQGASNGAHPDKVRQWTRSRVHLGSPVRSGGRQGWRQDYTIGPRSIQEAELDRSIWKTRTDVRLEAGIPTM